MKNKKLIIGLGLLMAMSAVACKKEGCTDPTAANYNDKAKKDDGSCTFAESEPAYTTPSSYVFADASGNSTVAFQGQTDRLSQLDEMITLMKTGTTSTLDAQVLKDMFANVGGNGNGNFSFTSTKQLKDKCFSLDVAMMEAMLDKIALTSQSNGMVASSGQAGVLTSGTTTYLFDENGFNVREQFEKGIMGSVFMYQALSVYFGDIEMNGDNTTAVDAANGEFYTALEHSWDEAFGYFGVDVNFPTVPAPGFWGEYSENQNALLNSNADMMNNFLKGRAAISANVLGDRDAAISAISKEWEDISAYQAIEYLGSAVGYFGNDNAQFLKSLSEAYGFVWSLRYSPQATRRLSTTEHNDLINMFGTNLWSLSVADINAIKNTLDAKY